LAVKASKSLNWERISGNRHFTLHFWFESIMESPIEKARKELLKQEV